MSSGKSDLRTKAAKLRLHTKTQELEKQLSRIRELKTSFPQLPSTADTSTNTQPLSSKSIQRNKEPIKTKSMSVEKWVESHERNNNNQQKQQANKKGASSMSKDLILFHHKRFRDSLDESIVIINAIKARKSTAKNYSIEDLNRLNGIQERLNAELIANIEIIERFNIHNEFNHIVSKVKLFLNEIDAFNRKQNRTLDSHVKLYEYT